jgi:hypothetical protein
MDLELFSDSMAWISEDAVGGVDLAMMLPFAVPPGKMEHDG